MNIGIQTWGSNGDIRPMLALADGPLRKAGHAVTLAVSSIDNKSYADICRQLDIAYLQVPERIEFDMQGFAQRTMRMNTLQLFWAWQLQSLGLAGAPLPAARVLAGAIETRFETSLRKTPC